MTIKKGSAFIRENIIFYLTALFIILGLKCYYRQADCDSLLWILAPTAHWVELLSKIPFTYISGTGYVNHSLRMVIAPSCSGVRFMIITFATLVFSFVHMIAPPRMSSVSVSERPRCKVFAGLGMPDMKTLEKGLGWIAVSVFFSWMITVFVNGLRIITAIYIPLYLENVGFMRGILTPDRVHTIIGVVVYFIALLTIYRLVGWFVQRIFSFDFSDRQNSTHFRNATDVYPDTCEKHSLSPFLRQCMPPVFWYFILTLGLPFLNRVNRDGMAEFTEFAILVTGCCTLILLPYVIIFFFRREK